MHHSFGSYSASPVLMSSDSASQDQYHHGGLDALRTSVQRAKIACEETLYELIVMRSRSGSRASSEPRQDHHQHHQRPEENRGHHGGVVAERQAREERKRAALRRIEAAQEALRRLESERADEFNAVLSSASTDPHHPHQQDAPAMDPAQLNEWVSAEYERMGAEERAKREALWRLRRRVEEVELERGVSDVATDVGLSRTSTPNQPDARGEL